MSTPDLAHPPRTLKFAPPSPFSLELQATIDGYFRDRQLSPKANRAMVAKTVVIFSWIAISYALLLWPGLSLFSRYLAIVSCGFGCAGMGMAIGHDALHGAYSHRPWVNRLLGLTFDAIGANSYIWRYTHNITHHTYTNIDGVDIDLDYDPLMRFTPNTPSRPAHRLQSFYAFLLYAMAGLQWLYTKDLAYFRRTRIGPNTNLKHSPRAWAGLIGGRLFIFMYSIVIPLWVLRPVWWHFLLGYCSFYVIVGLTMALVFQLAHAVEGPRVIPPPVTGRLDQSFLAHQLASTADFACDNRWLSWYVGGLNFQVEHHLFPHICSIHYPALRPLVRRVADKHGLCNHEFPTMRAALRSHVSYLVKMGLPAY